MVGHQAIRPASDAGLTAALDQYLSIQPIVILAEEEALAAVAPLGDVVRNVWNNDASKTGDSNLTIRNWE